MIDQLTFMKALVEANKKPVNPILNNILVHEGLLQVSDGRVTAIAEEETFEDNSFCVNANQFINACIVCDGEPNIKHKKMVVVNKGGFNARLATAAITDYPAVDAPDDYDDEGLDEFMDALRLLRPFVGETGKAAIWACGIRLTATGAYATNNTVVAYFKTVLPIEGEIVLPVFAIDMLLKIGTAPNGIVREKNSLWFHYDTSNGLSMWLRTILIAEQWPADAVENMLAPAVDLRDNSDSKLPVTLHDNIRKLAPFCEDSTNIIILEDDKITTLAGKTTASIEDEQYAVGRGRFQAQQLVSVLRIATHADFKLKPVPFAGDNFYGVMVGMRDV